MKLPETPKNSFFENERKAFFKDAKLRVAAQKLLEMMKKIVKNSKKYPYLHQGRFCLNVFQ